MGNEGRGELPDGVAELVLMSLTEIRVQQEERWRVRALRLDLNIWGLRICEETIKRYLIGRCLWAGAQEREV